MTGADLVEPEELGRSPPADCASWRILFRYSPIAGVRSGLDLRYRCEASPAGGGDKPRIAAVGIRWRSDTGRILLWQMPHRTMRLCAGPGWTPFPLPLPLPPRDCRFLRLLQCPAAGLHFCQEAPGRGQWRRCQPVGSARKDRDC
jgi:hypothetical protein